MTCRREPTSLVLETNCGIPAHLRSLSCVPASRRAHAPCEMLGPVLLSPMRDLLSINQTLRNLKRYAEIITVLAKHGFGDVVHETKLDRLVERGVSLVSAGRIRPEFEHLPRPVRLRQAMEVLGPTFVKLGQVLGTRPDLIPREWADEFKKLHDDVPQLDFE